MRSDTILYPRPKKRCVETDLANTLKTRRQPNLSDYRRASFRFVNILMGAFTQAGISGCKLFDQSTPYSTIGQSSQRYPTPLGKAALAGFLQL